MKFLDKKKVQTLEDLQEQKRKLKSGVRSIRKEIDQLVKKYEKQESTGSAISRILKKNSNQAKITTEIEKLTAEAEQVEQQLTDLEPKINQAKLAIYQDYFAAVAGSDKQFRSIYQKLLDQNTELRAIFKEASGVLNLNPLANAVPFYVRISPLENEFDFKEKEWRRMQHQVEANLTQPPEDYVEVVYLRRKPRSCYFIGKPSNVPKDVALADIDAGYCVPADEYDSETQQQ